MKKIVFRLTILLCLFWIMPISAQKRAKKGNEGLESQPQIEKRQERVKKKVIKQIVTGQVVNEKGAALIGVTVSANEGSTIVTTDAQGKFTIEINQGSTFLFEMPGYQNISMNEAHLASKTNKVVMIEEVLSNVDSKLELPYQTITQYKTTGLVSSVNPSKSLEIDTRYSLNAAYYGKIPGLLFGKNIHGFGNAVVVVDGVKRDDSYLNLMEIESITVLKDAVSRMLYGADGDMGVILVKTKSGEANKKIINVRVESGISKALGYPKYLNAAQYMTSYNKAQQNDASIAGTPLATPKFAQTLIDNTANKVDPILYPDNDYYSSEYVKDMNNYNSVSTEFSGGNSNAQYYLNMGWDHTNGWTKIGNNDSRDVMNIHGKVGFKVNSWMKMSSEVVGIFDITSLPNVNTFKTDGTIDLDYWGKASTYLPITQTLLIPTSRISNLGTVPTSSIVDGKYVLGGSKVYLNSLLGDMTRSGSDVTLNRYMQFNTGFDMNLKGITKGLTAKGFLSLNFNNTYKKNIKNSYSVYQMGVVDSVGYFPVTQIGVDNKTTQQTNTQTYFDRTISSYLSLNYDRSFDEHDISAVLVGTMDQYTQNAVFQQTKKLKLGLQANYTYKNRYLLDAGLLAQGSSKLPTNNKYGVAPTIGLGWIVSREGFMKNNKFVNYLKLRTSYGILQNDNWVNGKYLGYFLYETNYSQNQSVFTYGNGTGSNTPVLINSFASDVSWQTRKEFVAGFDSYLNNNKTWIEASYYNSESGNQVTEMTNNTPATLGSVPIFQNYNSTVYQGIEVGVKHTEQIGKFMLTIGVNYLYSSSKIKKIDEPVYSAASQNLNLEQVGTSGNALWGYSAKGLYSADDFDTSGKLLSSLPTPSFGSVKPGDIKYEDYNNDGKINSNDRHVLGLNGNNQVYSFDIDLRFGNWQFYALAVGLTGGKGFTNSNYYWFKGSSAKYSDIALNAYDPLNPDPNAKYPRLSLTNGNNNYQNSTFWEYDKSSFSISNVQIGYYFKLKQNEFIKGFRVYGRGSNLLTIAKDLDILRLSYQSAPDSKLFSIGVVASF